VQVKTVTGSVPLYGLSASHKRGNVHLPASVSCQFCHRVQPTPEGTPLPEPCGASFPMKRIGGYQPKVDPLYFSLSVYVCGHQQAARNQHSQSQLDFTTSCQPMMSTLYITGNHLKDMMLQSGKGYSQADSRPLSDFICSSVLHHSTV
jgi:hypothetical protein